MRKSENKTKRHESSKVIILTRDIDPCLVHFFVVKKNLDSFPLDSQFSDKRTIEERRIKRQGYNRNFTRGIQPTMSDVAR